MTSSIQSVGTGSPFQLLAEKSQIFANISQHLDFLDVRNLSVALLRNRTCIRTGVIAGETAYVFDASAMTIEEFKKLPVNKNVRKVILPAEYGVDFNESMAAEDIHRDTVRDCHVTYCLKSASQQLQTKFPNCKHVVIPGVDVNKCDHSDFSPLYFAVEKGSPDAVRLLLQAGADVNKFNGRGLPIFKFNTALMLSASRCNVTIVKMLLDAGAEVNTINRKKETALDLALANWYARTYRDKEFQQTVKMLTGDRAQLPIFECLRMEVDQPKATGGAPAPKAS